MTQDSIVTRPAILLFAAILFLPVVGFGQTLSPADSNELTVKILDNDLRIYGLPLGWDGRQAVLLKNDGGIRLVPAASEDDAEVVAQTFDPLTPGQMKSKLKKEFGTRYDVSLTEHFVVVHPWGKPDYWAKPFEEFYVGFDQFMNRSGLKPVDARFPMVIVVLRSRGDFDRYMQNESNFYDRSVVGFYSRLSNRMVTYDPAQMLRVNEERNWLYTSPTVVHETVHQLAFNRGIHNRLAPPPLWLSEGLAMLCEANGYINADEYETFKDRINQKRYSTLKRLYRQDRIKGRLVELISSNRMFGQEPELAYSLSWAISFYLAEKKPEKYFEFLRRDGEREDFSMVAAPDRLNAFASQFGNDFESLEEKMKVYFVGDESPDQNANEEIDPRNRSRANGKRRPPPRSGAGSSRKGGPSSGSKRPRSGSTRPQGGSGSRNR